MKFKKKIVYIASNGHSGSTLLELILCSHSKCIGIGEAFQLVDPRNKIIDNLEDQRCACGQFMNDCKFWENVIPGLKEIHDKHKKYLHIYDKCLESFGNDKLIIDSSKVPNALSIIKSNSDIELKVIHLIKDVRAWTVSMQKTYQRNTKHKIMTIQDY